MTTPNNPAQQKLVKVYTAANEMEARMVQELLRNGGTESIIQGEIGAVASGIYGAMMGDWARKEILVLESAAPEAERILSELPEPESPEINPDADN